LGVAFEEKRSGYYRSRMVMRRQAGWLSGENRFHSGVFCFQFLSNRFISLGRLFFSPGGTKVFFTGAGMGRL